jgi:hypothetical protein
MKPLRIVLPIVVAGIVVLVGIQQLLGRGDAEAFRLDREALRREMIERAVVPRGSGGPQGVEEARTVVRWWLDASTALRNRFPKQARAAEAPRAAGKEKDRDKEREAEAWRAYAKERLEALRAGYAPTLSAVDQGLRLDVLAIRPGEHPDTHERGLRIDFALWGAPRRIEREAGASEGARVALHVVVPVVFRGLAFRFLDASGKTYGEMSGSGEPYRALRDPDRFGGDLPPGVVLGTWWVEPFPREAERVEVSAAVLVNGMTSATLAPTFRWELPVPDAWKLRPGETFKAEIREAPPDTAAAR